MLHDSPMYSYIPAKDVARARKFYEGKLGLKPAREIEGGVYEFGQGTACFLYPTPNAGRRAQARRIGKSRISSPGWMRRAS